MVFLLSALAISALAVVGFGAVWSLTLGWLAPNRPAPAALLRFFIYTAPARYIPGTVPYHAARILFAERIGTRKLVVTASIAYEAILGIGAAVSVAVVGFLMTVGPSQMFANAYVLALLPLALLPLLLQPCVLVPIANVVLFRLGRDPISGSAVLSAGKATIVFVAYAVVHCLNGLAFWLVVSALTPDSVSPALAIGCYSLAAAAGVAVILAPSGIGAREAVIVATLSGAMPTEEAVVAAAAARAVSVLGELGLVGLFGVFDLGNRLWRRDRQRAFGPLGTSRPSST